MAHKMKLSFSKTKLSQSKNRGLDLFGLGSWIRGSVRVLRKALQVYAGKAVHILQCRRCLFSVMEEIFVMIAHGGEWLTVTEADDSRPPQPGHAKLLSHYPSGPWPLSTWCGLCFANLRAGHALELHPKSHLGLPGHQTKAGGGTDSASCPLSASGTVETRACIL